VYRTKTRLEIIEASTNKARLGDCQDGKIKTGVEMLSFKDKIFCGYYSLLAVRPILNAPSSYADSLTQFYNAVKDFPYEEGKFEFFKSVLSWNIDPDNSSLFCSEFVALGLQYAGLLSKSKASNNFVPKALSSEWPEVTLLEGATFGPEIYIRNPQPSGKYTSCKATASCECAPAVADPCERKAAWSDCDDGYAVTVGTRCIPEDNATVCKQDNVACQNLTSFASCDLKGQSGSGNCTRTLGQTLVCLTPTEVDQQLCAMNPVCSVAVVKTCSRALLTAAILLGLWVLM
jgi:hypothetical protein